jgi:alkanesulfonate monooxygenase SsuD/methylene tetrahydromethanopterin reductase-like flavin-dependent oxidoreductase (luciferase family)
VTFLSISAPQFGSDPGLLWEAARFAESAGIHGVYAFDHLTPLGRPTGPMFDMAATLGTVAASTSRIKVGSMVMRVSLRSVFESVALARSVQALAPGRTVIGLGIGDGMTEDEQRRFGLGHLSLTDRRLLMVQVADAIRADGGSVVLGGTHPGTRELTLDHADGWNAWDLDLPMFAVAAARLHSVRPSLAISWGTSVLLGRDRAEAEELAVQRKPGRSVRVWSASELVSACEEYGQAGADEILITLVPNRPDRWEVLADLVLPCLG